MNAADQTVPGEFVVALDAHGGDFGPVVTVPAALQVLSTHPGLKILLSGTTDQLNPLLDKHAASGQYGQCLERLEVCEASHALAPDARPVAALRRGKGSSLWLALELVAEGRAGACVSAGSTAALLALGVKLLGMLPGIERPALMSPIPSASGHTYLLDLGATLNVSANQLVQFAIMGAVACSDKCSANPARVALLNVGHEDGKGDTVVREAHAMLRELPINYRGFIEGHDLFAGKADVAVCDGFTGNLILKSGEGLAAMFFQHLESALGQGALARVGGMLAGRSLKRALARFEPAKHNGAPLLGLQGVVVKSHGNAGRKAMANAILEAVKASERLVPQRIETMINEYSIEG
ncbi:MAG: phosphate acyltransferase PlsX [Xanthomonadales bacterium]|nr:phosphate acyltransferase PlsX [Xanthomonadales bacterium]